MPKGGLVLARHEDSAKEWDALGDRDLVPSAITYEPKINSRTVQGEKTGDGARQEGGEADGGTENVGQTVNLLRGTTMPQRSGEPLDPGP